VRNFLIFFFCFLTLFADSAERVDGEGVGELTLRAHNRKCIGYVRVS